MLRTIGATMILQKVELFGFNPVVRVEHAINGSNLRHEETVEARVSLRIRSSLLRCLAKIKRSSFLLAALKLGVEMQGMSIDGYQIPPHHGAG